MSDAAISNAAQEMGEFIQQVNAGNAIAAPEDSAPGQLDASNTPVDNVNPFLTNAPESGLNEYAADPQSAEGQEAVASPAADSGNAASSSPQSSAAPQLDHNQQFQMALLQRMEAAEQRASQFQAQLLQTFAPKPAPAPVVDPFADAPPEFQTPEARKFLEYALAKAKGPVSEYQQQLEQRIEKAHLDREINRFGMEADSIANEILSTAVLDSQGQNRVRDIVRDLALSLTNVHGGSPAQYAQPIKATFDEYARGRATALGQAAKQKVAAQRIAPAAPSNQNAAPGMVSGKQQAVPTMDELQRAGYANRTEAIMNDYRKVFDMRARQGRG